VIGRDRDGVLIVDTVAVVVIASVRSMGFQPMHLIEEHGLKTRAT
jgi:hypothetical protein